jgi:hypothetical protein
MSNVHKFLLFLTLLSLVLYLPGFAQWGGNNCGGNFNPDSLTSVTVTGTAQVDSSMMYPMYYLDESGNGQPDYRLNFGPRWYQPDSGNATRPNNGDIITIYGGLHDSTMMGIPAIIVYEINGQFWRDPFAPNWNYMGGHMHGGGHYQGGCNGFAFGWMNDSLTVDTLNGTALVDTTFMFEQYFLDADNDGTPDYYLNFGPPWYVPTSGATRPSDGDQVNIVGGVLNRSVLPMVIVFEINGLVWRDSTGFGTNMGGGWIHRNMTQSQQFHSPFDTEDWMQFNPGWHGGGHMGGMMPNSLFCQMLELYPQNIPNSGNQNMFAGYEIGMFGSNGQNMMWQGGCCGGQMNFTNNIQYQMHYNDIQLQGYNIDENTIEVKYWDNQSNSWKQVTNATVDQVNNTVSLSINKVSNFVILTGNKVVASVEDSETLVADGFTLSQNYPNPFNPKTTISFEIIKDSQVLLTIYNVLGQKLFDLVNERMISGVHKVNFDATTLPSGTYFYELKVGNQSTVKRMSLLK